MQSTSGQAGQGGFLSRLFKTKDDTAPAWTALDAALAAVTDPVFVLDATDRILKMNLAGARLVGTNEDARSLAARLGSAELITHLRRWRTASVEETTPVVEIILRRAPAADIFLEGTAARIPVEAGVGEGLLFVVLRDVSRRKHLETLRRDFVANVSHDLRTPVTILKGFVETLHEDYDRLDDADRRRFVERLHRNTARLHRLLEDMLQLAMLESDGAVLNPVRGVLHPLLHEAADMLSDRFAAEGVSLEFSLKADDTTVAVDPPKFSRVIINLLENTLRHASGMTHIQIATAPEEDGSGGVCVSVSDDGGGIVQADMERMFERFFRADKSRAGEKSLGLGLSIVKHLVRLHGGTVSAVANRPRGLTVRLHLPPAEKVLLPEATA